MKLNDNLAISEEKNKSIDLSEKQSDRVNAISLDKSPLSKKNPNSFHDIIYQTSSDNSKTRIDLFSNDCGEKWTIAKLKDELFLHLLFIEINGKKKYEIQAKDLIHRIPVYQPTPIFVINQSDLSPKLIDELSSLDDINLDEVIKDVVSWIFESIDKKYFLLSIKRYGLISWRIEP